MDKTQQELIESYLPKARAKVRVARDLLSRGEWDEWGRWQGGLVLGDAL